MVYGSGIEDHIEPELVKDLMFLLQKKTNFRSHIDMQHKILVVLETDISELSSKTRKKEVAMKRHLFVFLMYNLTRVSLANIAKLVKRDHSTMINSRRAIVDEVNYNKEYRVEVEQKLTELYDLFTKETQSIT